MSRLFPLLCFLAVAVSGCNKTEENIIWQGTFGQGYAACVRTTSDTGFVATGTVQGNQYLIFLKSDKTKALEYKPDLPGVITNVMAEKGYFLTAGSTEGKMILSKIDTQGKVIWDSLFITGFEVDHTSLCWLGGDNYLAVGSPDPDSTITAKSGLSFIWFNSSGTIKSRKDVAYGTYTAARAVTTDNSGNIFLGISKMGTGGNLKAAVAKYSSDAFQIWEKDLYNNPSFGAASLGITLDGSGNPVISGRTGMQVSTGLETSTFVAKYYHTGDSVANNYLEYSNAGASVMPDGKGMYYVLNRKCIVINIVDRNMDYSGIIRTFSSCDSKNTQNYANSFDITSDGNLIMAGSSGGNFYLVIKSSSALSPV